MIYLLLGIVTVAAAWYVIKPLHTLGDLPSWLDESMSSAETKKIARLEAAKDAVYENIRELDFEHEMGKLSPEDYQRLRNEYLARAAELLDEIEKARTREAIDKEVEREVRVRRFRRPEGGGPSGGRI